ncbi:MAG: hypothetical protein ACREK4_18435 [Candidatus Rokuibacteriota bacterium]
MLQHYRRLPGTLGRILRDDRRTAAALHQRGLPLDVVENAFVLAIARRTFRSDTQPLDPIRSLRYFLPVIDELRHAPPLPEYLEYLRNRLVTARVYPAD